MGEASKKNPLVKSAVEALSKGSHEEAVRFCKQLIKQDRKNYDAHVVLGKALFSGKQYDKAEVPYRLATNLNPTSLRIWQGLVELHEALGEFEKVVDACESIIQIAQTTDDKVRQIDYLRRLAIAHAKSHNPEKASQTWKVLLNSPSISKDLHFEALCGLADAQLIKMDKLRLELSKCYPQKEQPTFWTGKKDMTQPLASLASVPPEDSACSVQDERMLEDTGDSLEKLLRAIIDISPQTQRYLDELRAEEGSFASAEECVRRGQLAVSHFQNTYGFSLKLAELRLQLVVANALLSSKSYDKSNESFNIIAKSAEELAEVEASRIKFAAIEGQIKVCLAKEQFAEAQCKLEHLLALDANNHWALAELGWLAFQEGSFNDASTLLVQAVNIQPDNASYHYRLGLLYWKTGDHTQTYKEKAVEQFVLSAKLDPSNGDVYRFLGNYYNQISRDTHRASRCYQKSVTLNAEDSEAGEALCDILDGEGRETLEAVICHEASQTSPRAFWAWRRMGYIQVHQKKWSDAVGYLQHAIRGYPACADLWEAIDQFRLALEKAPQNLAAQYGLASGLLGMSKECMAMGAFGWGASLAKVAYAQCLPWEEEGGSFKNERKAFSDSVHSWKQKRLSAAVGAKHAYQHALRLSPWQANLCLSEVLALGGLILESANAEFWVTLGCLSKHKAMQQHAYIRALQVDGSNALAWAHLGKLYIKEGQALLAKQALDRARSSDPLLALSWAGMSVHGHHEGGRVLQESFANCLYAVQLMPVVEFQLGLGMLASSAGQLQLSKVFAAVQQAVQRAPHHPESHNLSGLVWESRWNFQRAIVDYKRARYALELFGGSAQSSSYNYVSHNLARVYCQNAHIASRCSCTDLDNAPSVQGSTSTPAMLGVAAIACSDCGASDSRFAFSTCRNQGAVGVQVILQLQRWLHKEPWNYTARYLLVLNIYQKAREKKYPYHLCQIVNRLMSPALSNFPFNTREHISPYKELQLLLCASEISLQRGDYSGSLKHATTASHLEISQGMLFFAHLQLARCYASQRDLPSLHSEYIKCLHLRTGCEIGWIALCVLEARYQLQDQNNSAVANCRLSLDDKGSVQNLWMALLELVRGQSFLWEEDFLSAEKAFAQACSMWPEEGCLYLIHGAICLELARQRSGSQFLSLAVHSLSTAQDVGQFSLPIASVLLAQAETSIGSGKDKCERNIRLEWSVWPKDLRPAEIFFQMHLLAKRSRAMSEGDKDWPESSKSSRSWLLKAVHLNPSCSRYWEIVRQVLKLN